MAALVLTTYQKTLLDAVDTKLDQQFVDGTNNPDTSENAPVMTNYSEQTTVIKKTWRDIFRQAIAAVLSSLENWTAPTFTNSWVNYGNGYSNAGYYKDPFGIVRLRGMISGGTMAFAAFTLPSGYRPETKLLCSTISNAAAGRVDIGTDGTVTVFTPSTNAWVSLEGITFRVA
jgi:hypothetical protein